MGEYSEHMLEPRGFRYGHNHPYLHPHLPYSLTTWFGNILPTQPSDHFLLVNGLGRE